MILRAFAIHVKVLHSKVRCFCHVCLKTINWYIFVENFLVNEFCNLIKTFLLSGLSLPNVTCAAGYFCRRNATSGTPNQGIDANICPVGHYCPKGTGEPFNCPLGTFGNDTGMYVLLCS